MNRFVELTAVDWRNERNTEEDHRPHLAVVGEDDLELPVAEQETTASAAQINTYPIDVSIDDIREYYPRRHGRTGTRIVYKNGAARPVKESHAEVRAKIKAALKPRSRAGSSAVAEENEAGQA